MLSLCRLVPWSSIAPCVICVCRRSAAHTASLFHGCRASGMPRTYARLLSQLWLQISGDMSSAVSHQAQGWIFIACGISYWPSDHSWWSRERLLPAVEAQREQFRGPETEPFLQTPAWCWRERLPDPLPGWEHLSPIQTRCSVSDAAPFICTHYICIMHAYKCIILYMYHAYIYMYSLNMCMYIYTYEYADSGYKNSLIIIMYEHMYCMQMYKCMYCM